MLFSHRICSVDSVDIIFDEFFGEYNDWYMMSLSKLHSRVSLLQSLSIFILTFILSFILSFILTFILTLYFLLYLLLYLINYLLN